MRLISLGFFINLQFYCCGQDTIVLYQVPYPNSYFSKNVKIDSLYTIKNRQIKPVKSYEDSTLISFKMKTGKTVDSFFYKAKSFVFIFDSGAMDTLLLLGKYKSHFYFPFYIPIPNFLIDSNGNENIYVSFTRQRNTLKLFFSKRKHFGILYSFDQKGGVHYTTIECKLKEMINLDKPISKWPPSRTFR